MFQKAAVLLFQDGLRKNRLNLDTIVSNTQQQLQKDYPHHFLFHHMDQH